MTKLYVEHNVVAAMPSAFHGANNVLIIQWTISNNGFRSDSLYEKKIGEDLVFNNALPKSLTITQVACLKAKPKLHNGMVYRQFIMIPVVLIDATTMCINVLRHRPRPFKFG